MYNKSTHKKNVMGYDIDPQKFWLRVQKSDDQGCWNWIGGRNTGGYGLFSVRSLPADYERTGRTRTQVLAHRVIAFWESGHLEQYDYVLHRCDNPSCCNPAHLLIATQQDNVDDMISKGRACWQRPSWHPVRG